MHDEVVGREVELAAVFRFLDALPAGPCTLLIEGEAGIGKTTVWAEGVEEARRRAYWVLATRPSQSEAKLSFTALSDLTEVVLDLMQEEIPAPQRHALEVALLRSRPQSGLFDRRAISAAFLGMVRALSLRGPVVLAIDDLLWLDAPSARRPARLLSERLILLPRERPHTDGPRLAGWAGHVIDGGRAHRTVPVHGHRQRGLRAIERRR